MRVRVPLGEKALTGVVLPGEALPAERVRDLLEVLDDEPICPPDLLATAAQVADRFFASTGEVLKSVLPARLPAAGAVRYRITEMGALARTEGLEGEILGRLSTGESVRVSDLPGAAGARRAALRGLEERGFVRATASAAHRSRRVDLAYLPAKRSPEEREAALGRGRKARDVLDLLDALGRPASAAEIRARTGASGTSLKGLVEKGLLHSFEQERGRPEPAVADKGRGITSYA